MSGENYYEEMFYLIHTIHQKRSDVMCKKMNVDLNKSPFPSTQTLLLLDHSPEHLTRPAFQRLRQRFAESFHPFDTSPTDVRVTVPLAWKRRARRTRASCGPTPRRSNVLVPRDSRHYVIAS